MTLQSEPNAGPPEVEASPRSRWRLVGRLLLFLVGVLAVVVMVRQFGAEQIGAAIARTAVWLPLICLLDFSWVALEGGALLAVYGPERRQISLRLWLYTSFVHYAAFMLLPMGRATAEVTRAAVLKRFINRDLAVVGAALMQSLTMVGNGITSLVAAGAVFWFASSRALTLALLTNAALMLVFGIVSYLVLRHVKVGGFLARRFERFAEAGPGFDQQFSLSRRAHPRALAFCLLGRVVQTAQYGVIVCAVTGHFSFAHAWIAEGIQMAARSAGDFVPNQIGVTEGAFVLFRHALDLAELPALAMTIALVARISNVSVASLCALLAQLCPPTKRAQLT